MLAPCVSLSARAFQEVLRDWIGKTLWKKSLFPIYLLLLYVLPALVYKNFNAALTVKLFIWYFGMAIFFSVHAPAGKEVSWRDGAVTLLLWLPIEFSQFSGFDIVVNDFITIPALPFAAVAFGIYLFVVLRNLPDIGYTFMWKLKDLATALTALLILAVILVPLGTSIGFIHPSAVHVSVAELAKLLFGIYFMVALPEELLFRGIIQNLLQKWVPGRASFPVSLIIASVIFGVSHYNNFNPPDWRYVYLATIAGIFYGFTYWKTGKTTVSALVHCGVNTVWATVFPGTAG